MRKIILILILILWGCGSSSINSNQIPVAPEWWKRGSSSYDYFYGYGQNHVKEYQGRIGAIVYALNDIIDQYNLVLLSEKNSKIGGGLKLSYAFKNDSVPYLLTSNGEFSLEHVISSQDYGIDGGIIEYATRQQLQFRYKSYKVCEIEYDLSVQENSGGGVEYFSEFQLLSIKGANGYRAVGEYGSECYNDECEEYDSFVSEGVLNLEYCSVESFVKDLKSAGFFIVEEYIDDRYYAQLGIDINYFNAENLKGEENEK